MTRIKLCGLTREEDIKIANDLKPEYVGFVFYDKSFRNLTKAQAKKLKGLLDPQIKAVGVFVDVPVNEIKELFAENIIDVAQLHGHEDEAYIKELKANNIPVIKTFQADLPESILLAEKSSADMIMFDTGKGGGVQIKNLESLTQLKRPFILQLRVRK